jgi:capping protein alpha
MADDEYDQATPEQKLSIAKYFIMSSPSGEVHEVLADVNKLVNDPAVLNDEALNTILKEYNEKQLQSAKTPDGAAVVVSSTNHIGDDCYVEPNSGSVYKFDHRKHVFTENTENKQSLDGDIEAFRKAIQDGLDKYNARQYKAGKCTMVVFGDDTGNITINVSARNINLNAYWSGAWRSVATFNCKEKSAELAVNTRIEVHYFEDGNVQLHAALAKSPKIKVTDAASTATSVCKALEEMESSYQSSLEDMYVEMHSDTIKKMRRMLPMNKQPMVWNLAAHSLRLGS